MKNLSGVSTARHAKWRINFKRSLHTPVLFTLSLLLSLFYTPAHAATLDEVRERGSVRCGVNASLAGFSRANSLGEYSGFDSDFCRAVASAVFDDSEAVEWVPLSSAERFAALTQQRIDILSRNTTWTLWRNTRFGDFAGISFYDGQGFMAFKQSGIRSALQLDNQPLCITRGTTSEFNTADFFNTNDMRFRPLYFDTQRDSAEAYLEGRCRAITTDTSGLAALRSRFQEPDAHQLLPEVISKEPLGPMVPLDDSEWENVVRWTLNCMINAEELSINSDNVDARGIGDTVHRRRLLGLEGDAGAQLGLNRRWCAQVIRQVGNYAEVYERHLGEQTPLGLPRGINSLWTNGGLLFAPPVR